MKCPKCGYLGFETTDRCRNCQYDFSLSPANADPDLTLRLDSGAEDGADFELPAIKRQTDNLGGGSLDLDRLFGDSELGAAAVARAEPAPLDAGAPATSFMTLAAGQHSPVASALDAEPAGVPSALPFDEAPLRPPRAARMPLAVRRATPEIARNRPRPTRPVRIEAPLAFDAPPPSRPGGEAAALASETVASLMQAPPLAARLAASVIDLALLLGIDAFVLVLTLRIAGLETTVTDVRVIPVVPFLAFLGLLAFGYAAAFTVAGGQTIGKMLLKLRVIGDDGRPIDAAGGVLRAAGCMLVPVTLGLSYVPALFSSDHRALHDRLAGTRVVKE